MNTKIHGPKPDETEVPVPDRNIAKGPAPQTVVYTMGKVGSRAIDLALERAGVNSWHIHTLDQDQIRWHTERALEAGRLPPGHIGTSIYLLQRNLSRPLYISCVRDPVARNLSAFFQNLTDYVPDPTSVTPQFVLDTFADQYPHDIPLTWFDREWRDHLGINIYEQHGSDISYLIFTEDTPNEQRSKLLSDAIGVEIRVGNSNRGELKQHGALYTEIKRRARLDTDLADKIYSSRFVKRFWNTDEINAMHQSWTEAD